jgi:hypothetical protein
VGSLSRSGLHVWSPNFFCSAGGRLCEGFRMTAPSGVYPRARGRRPKASREGTRGMWSAMMIPHRGRRVARAFACFEHLDDAHGRSAARARLNGHGRLSSDVLGLGRRGSDVEQLAGEHEVVGLHAARQQTVVADVLIPTERHPACSQREARRVKFPGPTRQSRRDCRQQPSVRVPCE